MSAEAVMVSGDETQTTPEQLEESLQDAWQDFGDLTFQPEFETKCEQAGLDVAEDTAKPEYWRAVAEFGNQRAAADREAGLPEQDIALRQLYANTPNFVYSSYALEQDKHSTAESMSSWDRQAARNVVSAFGDMLHSTAQAWPDIRTSQLGKQMLNIANMSVENRPVKDAAANIIKSKIVGTQHEAAFEQILDATGRNWRVGTVKEDQRGADYVVGRPFGNGVDYVDVKASVKSVGAEGASKSPASRATDGTITMHSMVTERELNDRFYVAQSVAQSRAQAVNRLLDNPAMIPSRRTK